MDPFTGTWIANVAKSQRHPNHLFQSATLHFEQVGEAITLTQAGVNMSGKHESSTLTLHPDGEEHPVSAQAPGVVVVTKWVGSRMLDMLATKDGAVVGRGTYEVSNDGSTLTAQVRGTDAAGKPFEQAIVFDRE